ncbi:MAG: putative methyltransferase (TIGR04325 family) [Bacteriovoracaceae bacterium]|jgi:putative methyltransferase (TIGR04325 family)
MLEKIKENYLVKKLRIKKYDKKFLKNKDLNLFRGVFPSFKEAEEAIPSSDKSGYDNEESAKMYKHLCHKVFPSDYPKMFWLNKILKEGSKLYDLGGHIGIKYYSYQSFFEYPNEFKWTVYDVEAVRNEGRSYASSVGAGKIDFSDTIDNFDGYDVLFVSGSLQYIDFDLAKSIESKSNPPKYILLSIPLTNEKTFYTVNNIGTAFCVYVLRNDKEFIASFEALGYTVKDRWNIPGKICEIPFYPNYSIEGYKGILLELK